MKTNAFGQQLKDSAPTLPSDNYHGEYFAAPGSHAIAGEVAYTGSPKVYNMAYIQGAPHIVVESYFKQGVVVSYLLTGQVQSWDWKHRNEAWTWAKARKHHVGILR